MKEKKFEEIMDNWASQEKESAPQLHPTKEMYQMVKAKKRKVFFPVFARWATVGIAAAVIIVVGTFLYPDIFRSSTPLEQSKEQEESLVEPQKEDVSKKGVPAPTRGTTDELETAKTALEGSGRQYNEEARKELFSNKREDVKVADRPLAPTEDASDSLAGQPAPAPGIAKSRTTSGTRKAQVIPPRAAVPQGAEGEFESNMSYRNGQFATPELLISAKDTAGEKHVGSKIFRGKNGIWFDTGHSQEKEIIKIKRDSQAYHDLITAMPDLKAFFEIGQNVIVNIGEYSIEIADEGKTELAEDELKKLVKE